MTRGRDAERLAAGGRQPLTYYHATANAHKLRPRLQGEHTADVCVIGAGFTGLSAAYELARHGFRVILLEGQTIGWGASGRNGGQICTGFSSGMGKVEAQLGRADAERCFRIAEEGKVMIASNIAEHGIACDLQWGYLHVAPKPSAVDDLKQMQEELASYGYTHTSVLDRDALMARVATTAYHGALREAHAGHFHPLNYCLGLADACEECGVEIYEQSQAVRVEGGRAPRVTTAEGSVSAHFVVAAGGAYLEGVLPGLRRRVMPVGSFVVTTEPLPDELAYSLIRDDEAVADTNFVLDYFRLTADRRLLFGGRCTYSGLIPENVEPWMRPRLKRVFPQLADVPFSHRWGGYIGITMNRMPDLGRLDQTIYYAQGFSGQGVVVGTVCGRLMAEAIAGQAGRFDLLARIRHQPFPGGPMRTPLLVLAMLWYRMRDALG
ncbi:NAD(P)/FAD-dependent oxidoreductase [Rhodoligotrophos defluvii]|uniref:NAD(P)/FAD-dependent oxidoreductase n=1 Tax=Rhodoligotrophos defluvii TaxID=2561934 RepID=UPI0019606663|nr:FAD-binding oxidoreductase [Rhodoligotrophos defluvii]